jgi:hypothetical protein
MSTIHLSSIIEHYFQIVKVLRKIEGVSPGNSPISRHLTRPFPFASRSGTDIVLRNPRFSAYFGIGVSTVVWVEAHHEQPSSDTDIHCAAQSAYRCRNTTLRNALEDCISAFGSDGVKPRQHLDLGSSYRYCKVEEQA